MSAAGAATDLAVPPAAPAGARKASVHSLLRRYVSGAPGASAAAGAPTSSAAVASAAAAAPAGQRSRSSGGARDELHALRRGKTTQPLSDARRGVGALLDRSSMLTVRHKSLQYREGRLVLPRDAAAPSQAAGATGAAGGGAAGGGGGGSLWASLTGGRPASSQ